jgi:alpha-ketoglutaric semialdehyde dehydrogenase
MLIGKNLVAGEWLEGVLSFTNEPIEGEPDHFSHGTPEMIDKAVRKAQEAFESFGYSSRSERSAFLRTIADEIEKRTTEIVAQGVKETGLPAGRLTGEKGRTCAQLRLFADHIEDDAYLDICHIASDPDRAPLPRPDLKMVQRPLGPVGVFGASNFPLAFSTAGGDTAAAFAAGCPVVVKGHPAHPGVCDLVAQAIHAAIMHHNLHPGVFSQVQGGDRAIGEALVQHPMIKAIGFTGSLGGGRALFDLCAARPEPIPFFGELGSINPVFLLPQALSNKAPDIAKGWIQSLTLGAGQFCTNPGVVVVLKGSEADNFIHTALEAVKDQGEQPMLTKSMAQSYLKGQQNLADNTNVQTHYQGASSDRHAAPAIFSTSAKAWISDAALGEEVFGPAGLIIIAETIEDVYQVARALEGQLTCSVHHEIGDALMLQKLLPILEQKAGRLLSNGFPTGVEVSHAMVHGGPYPASTNFGATSVGTLSIRRFLRPVAYQDFDWSSIDYTRHN